MRAAEIGAMVTWASVCEHLRDQTVVAGPDWVGLAVGAVPMKVRVKVKCAAAMGEPYLATIAEVAAEGRLSPRAAILYNGQLASAALVLEDGVYLMRQWLRVETLDLEHLDRTIAYLVGHVARLRHQLVASTSPFLFANFAE